jgi:predicted transcriptional regulator
MISRKKGATIDEVHAVVGKKRSSVYNHIYLIKKAGYEIVKTYDKKSGTHRYRLG